MTYLSTPLRATGWERTLVNDSEGNTVLLMPNGHKGLEAVKEATALFAAAPEMLAALDTLVWQLDRMDGLPDELERMVADAKAAIAKAKGEVA
jgi:hypothetical protein